MSNIILLCMLMVMELTLVIHIPQWLIIFHIGCVYSLRHAQLNCILYASYGAQTCALTLFVNLTLTLTLSKFETQRSRIPKMYFPVAYCPGTTPCSENSPECQLTAATLGCLLSCSMEGTWILDILIHQIHDSKNKKTKINKQQCGTESWVTCTQHTKGHVTKAIWLQSRQRKHVKTAQISLHDWPTIHWAKKSWQYLIVSIFLVTNNFIKTC